MKKSTIWFLAIIMALTFMGLLYVQIMYMRNMVRMRNDQFAEGVKRSLYSVTTRLEQDETKHFLDEDMANIETSFLPRYNADGTAVMGTYTSTFKTPEGLTGGITLERQLDNDKNNPKRGYQTNQEILRGLYLYQKGLLNEVILNIISRSSDRPISERADSAKVAGYMTSEFNNNGLDLPFEFAVVNRVGAVVYKTRDFNTASAEPGSMFVQTLFPNDPTNKMNYIKVYFPTKSDYIFSSVRFMIPSFFFTLILLLVFLYTIIVAFRQKKLTEMKNDFINNMTHEFKTPISTISLAAQMLNDPAVLKSENMLRHISTVINDETKRLRFQVEKVLQMSMFDRQKATLRLTEVDVNTVVANALHTFKLKVGKYGGSIEARLDADDSIIEVDEMHFTNVIFNLLDNALKYRREDVAPHLVIDTRNRDNDKKLEISVADNGIGIRRDDLKKIFDKFYRVSTGNRHDVKGFGLGLAYVRKMVGEFGGEITVDSEFGKGTKFNIILPLTKTD